MSISKRLEAVINLVKYNEKIIDIGTDHAIIPIELYKRGITTNITATENSDGPYKIAENNIKENKLEDKIKLILSNGFDKISPRYFDRIIILGMGSKTICEILSPKKSKIRAKLVIHSTNNNEIIRKKISSMGYQIVDELFIKEKKANNIIIVAEFRPFNSYLSKKDKLLGPILSKNMTNEIYEYYDDQLTNLLNIYKKNNNKEELRKIKILTKFLEEYGKERDNKNT